MVDLAPGPLLLVFALDHRLAALLGDCLESAPLSPGDFAVTSALNLVEPVRPSDLAAVLGMRPTTLSNYLRRLAADGLLVREPHPTDGRAALIRLTARGRAATEGCFPGFRQALDAFSTALSQVGVTLEEATAQLHTLEDAMARAGDLLKVVHHVDPAEEAAPASGISSPPRRAGVNPPTR